MRRTLQAASRIIGIPVPLEIERKYLLKHKPDFTDDILIKARKIFIEQIYLVPATSNEELRIRKRTQGGYSSYYQTHKIKVKPGVRQETEISISATDYWHLQSLRDLTAKIIRKNRYYFEYKHQYFELDEFIEPADKIGLWLLEIELTEENDRVELPPFLKIFREVTAESTYSSYEIARQ